jgi:hypothetical protein
VKLADYMEMFRFLALEVTMGNRYVDGYLAEILDKVVKEYPDMAELWMEWAMSMRKMRGTTRGATT